MEDFGRGGVYVGGFIELLDLGECGVVGCRMGEGMGIWGSLVERG